MTEFDFFAFREAAIPAGYKPTDDEEYMSPIMLAYFYRKLLSMRDELRRGAGNLSHGEMSVLEKRNHDRDMKMLAKVDLALGRIEGGTYGICEDTDEPIPVARLDARPQTTVTYDAQERREFLQKGT